MMDPKKGLTAPLFVPHDFLRLDQLLTPDQSCYLFLKFTNENEGGLSLIRRLKLGQINLTHLLLHGLEMKT